ncbi:acyl carrier protein [Paenibacillus sp. 481]|uniref:acyl carrier protein n=1 Tax=Paenibacillus sp. 481 TaxID=2835869 RepID=UPI001E639105|nr:acyl carrier protein [Paenibacillus sp. 481]UHA73998.1 acyl carrier protein [Paenibacillus sp. 481]
MNRDAIEQEITQLIKDMLNVPAVDADTELVGNAGVLDSMTIVRLLTELEQRFQFTFDEDDLTLESISTVKRLTDLVLQNRQAQ